MGNLSTNTIVDLRQKELRSASSNANSPANRDTLDFFSGNAQIDTSRKPSERLFHISNILQTTLDVEQVILLFTEEIKCLVPFDSVLFINDLHKIQIKTGRSRAHRCQYRLIAHEQPLGELTLTRKTRFSKIEINELEYLLCSLVNPLSNAFLYHQALQKAHKDPLTGVNNRATMDDTLTREVELAHRHKTPLSLLVLDIDHFKQFNDNYGHTMGDELLKRLTQCTMECVRRSDILFRYGGEEFVVLLNNTGQIGAKRLAERIRKSVEKLTVEQDEQRLNMTISIGIASLQDKEDEKTLFNNADKAMYQAKADGRNCVRAS